MEKKNVWLTYEENELSRVMEYNEGYKAFLSAGKTERECVDYAICEAREKGYRDLKEVIKKKSSFSRGIRYIIPIWENPC